MAALPALTRQVASVSQLTARPMRSLMPSMARARASSDFIGWWRDGGRMVPRGPGSGAGHGHAPNPDGAALARAPHHHVFAGSAQAQEHVPEVAGDGHFLHGMADLPALHPEPGGAPGIVP